MNRRGLLARGVPLAVPAALTGCTGETDDGRVQDSDGDGMIDSEDYAPRDPDVQERSDVENGGGGAEGAGTNGGGAGGTDGGDGGSTNGADGAGGDGSAGGSGVSYPSHSGTHTITAADNYWAWEFSVSDDFALEYAVTNLKDENFDFDVLLYDTADFEQYRRLANEVEDGVRPQYLEGSAPGIASDARQAVQFQPGTYYLVVDNTDLSDAGDFGTEAPRRVRVDAVTRAP